MENIMFRTILSSDASLEYYPLNKMNNFKVQLAETITADKYECALVEIKFPNRFINIREGYNEVIIVELADDVKPQQVLHRFKIPAGNYTSFKELYTAMMTVGRNIQFKQLPFTLRMSRISKKIILTCPKPTTVIQFGGDVATFLGFPIMTAGAWPGYSDLLKGRKTAKFQTTTTGGVNSIYIYTDIIKEQFVGGIKSPLLRIVNIPNMINHEEEYISITYDKLYFSSLKSVQLDSINIQMYDREGHEIQFQRGVVTAILEFQPISNPI